MDGIPEEDPLVSQVARIIEAPSEGISANHFPPIFYRTATQTDYIMEAQYGPRYLFVWGLMIDMGRKGWWETVS